MKKFEDLTTEELKAMYEVYKNNNVGVFCNREKPSIGDDYYWVTGYFTIDVKCWKEDTLDKAFWKGDNYFKTKEQAELAKTRIIVKQELKDRCHIPTEEDWFCYTKNKYFMFYDYEHDKISKSFYNQTKQQGTIYTLKEQDLEAYITEKGEEFVKKYIFDIDE